MSKIKIKLPVLAFSLTVIAVLYFTTYPAQAGKSTTSQDQKTQRSKSVAQQKEAPETVNSDVSVITIPAKQLLGEDEGDALFTKSALPATTIPGNEIEPNGTPATASPIASNVRVTGNLFPNGDVDFYSFNASAGDRVYATTMTAFSAGSSTDSQLTLLASDGMTVIEFDDDDGSFAALSSSIAGATIPTSGTYYLKVNDYTANTTSERPYDLWLRVQSGTPTPEVEPNDTPATATPLPASGWVSGARNPAAATEQDWYSMSLNAGDTVYLGLDLDPERDGTTFNGRLGMGLFGDAGNQILLVDDPGNGDVSPNPNIPSEALFVTVKNAGTYFAFVDSATAATGGPTATYHLSVSVLPRVQVGVNCTTYTSTDVPKTIGPGTGLVSSTLTVPGHPRIASTRVSINLNHALMADIDAHLRSPALNDNGLFTDIGAATTTGGQTQMDLTLDDTAGSPPFYTALKGVILKPELAYRLNWFKGEDAGGTWTLDLRDDGNNASGGTLNSWGLEICEEPPLASCSTSPATVFATDFESGTSGFTHSGTQDEWELGTPATPATTTANPVAAFTNCHSGTNCWKTDLDSTYNLNSSQDLLSPNINLAGYNGTLTLSWAMRYQMESASFDHAYVEVQEVGGANPLRVWEWLDATMTDAVGNPVTNIGASAGWGVFRADISRFAGKNIEVRFHLDSDNTVVFAGLAIDDVTVTACAATPLVAGNLVISEFRLRGPNPNGATNEFIEIYNSTNAPIRVGASDASAGFAVAASDGVVRCTIPNGTVIPARGHFLCANSTGYSLANYPAGSGTTATPDATYTLDIPDNAGLALFNTANTANFTLANRLDAVGSTSEASTLYKEGTGYSALAAYNIDCSFYRKNDTTDHGLGAGLPQDTNNNATDFLFVDTSASSAGAGQRLGAPGPENLSSPVVKDRTQVPSALVTPTVAQTIAPNRVRDYTADAANNSTQGTLAIRRTFTNNTGAPITRLRFRIIDITTYPVPSGTADLRPLTSTSVIVSNGITNVTAQGLTLETPPTQEFGGGFNSSLSAGTIQTATPLAPGGTISVNFLLGVQQAGAFRFFVNIEANP